MDLQEIGCEGGKCTHAAPVASFCEYDSGPSGSVKVGDYMLMSMNNCVICVSEVIRAEACIPLYLFSGKQEVCNL
jgi:hypothetical protein